MVDQGTNGMVPKACKTPASPLLRRTLGRFRKNHPTQLLERRRKEKPDLG
jgi:hypothetical protein